MKPHHWSGFPGAYCLDCGEECRVELCVAEHTEDDCKKPEHVDGSCPSPWKPESCGQCKSRSVEPKPAQTSISFDSFGEMLS